MTEDLKETLNLLSLKELDQRIKAAYDKLDSAETDEEVERLEALIAELDSAETDEEVERLEALIAELESQGVKKIEDIEKMIQETYKKMQEMQRRIELENAILYAPG